MSDDALRALLEERWREAAARYGERVLADPRDAVARTNRAVALYEAGRWREAAREFEELLRREGPASEVAPPALFSLGYCRLELDDARGSLEATTLFLDFSNEEHPFYWDGVQNLACAARLLGQHLLAVQLHRVVLGVRPGGAAFAGLALALAGAGRGPEALFVIDAARRAGHRHETLDAALEQLPATAPRPTPLTAPRWSRHRILRAAFRVLGWDRQPLPPSLLAWRKDG